MTNSPLQINSQKTFINDALTNLDASSGGTRAKKWDPLPYGEQPAKQEALNCISLLDPWRSKLYEERELKWRSRSVINVKKKDYEIASDPVKLAESYTALISHHIVMRVALFFQQAVICYKTPFHYEISNTDNQILGAKNLKIKAKNCPSITIKYQAAHSSTIPSLKACPIKAYTKALEDSKEPKYFSFLNESYMAYLDNSTNSLPDFVNKVDTLIDCSAEGLRGFAIKLINKLAKEKATPCQATRVFLYKLLDQLRECHRKSKKLTKEKKTTLFIYKRAVKELICIANESAKNSFFDQLLSVNLINENDTDFPIIRKIVYERKFNIICQAQCVETKINRIFEKQFPLIKTPAKKHAIKLCLIYTVRKDKTLRNPLQKLFAISINGIKSDRNLCKRLKLEYQTSKEKYDVIQDKIRKVISHFQKLEQSFQASLLKDFREKLRNLSQQELSIAIKDVVRNKIEKEKLKPSPQLKKIKELESIAMSVSTISRLENYRIHSEKNFKTPENQRMKKMTVLHAKIISKALNVDPGHYFCSFFASAEVI